MATSTECTTPRVPETTVETTGKGVSYFRPDVDVIENNDGFTVIADLPGVKPESISIEFDKGTLTLTAAVKPRQAQRAITISTTVPAL